MVTALAIEAEEATDVAIFVSCDVAFTPRSLWKEVRERLAESRPSFDGRKLLLNATHTRVMRIGDIAFATNPFELFVDHGLQIKARSPASQTVLAQLVGRGLCLPTQRTLDGGGYSVNPEVSLVGPEGGPILVEGTLRMINELWDSWSISPQSSGSRQWRNWRPIVA